MLNKLQTDSEDTIVSYQKMATGLAEKFEKHKAQHEHDTERFVERLKLQGDAIS